MKILILVLAMTTTSLSANATASSGKSFSQAESASEAIKNETIALTKESTDCKAKNEGTLVSQNLEKRYERYLKNAIAQKDTETLSAH